MSRVGWVVLAGIVLVAALFASMVRVGGPVPSPPPAARMLVAGPTADARGLPVLVVPVVGVRRDQILDSWGDARGGGRAHKGNDIMAPGGTAVVAVADGTIEKLFESRLGGTTIYQRSADGRWIFYYAHLQGYLPGLRERRVVRANDPIGYVGDTGDAGPGNTHLHFSVTRMAPGQRWWQGEDVNPYSMLRGR